ncbi:MAG: LLM class F420-dependent oxidoreductase, partial [Nitriliruptoraceae bacterium]
MSGPELAVSLGLWLDRPADEVVDTARVADACGYPELWVGEMATYDAPALATAIGRSTSTIELTLGPLAVAVRDPAGIAMAAASVADLTGRRCGVALGTSSPVVVEGWHGRSRARSARALRESAEACGQLLAGQRCHLDGEVVRTTGYRLRLSPPAGALTVAAFGPAAIRVAAELGDRMVANLVATDELASLRAALDAAAEAADRATPPR